jgi:Flp pilus assembly pilin Flp
MGLPPLAAARTPTYVGGMSDISIEAYVRISTFLSGLAERAREHRGQTAAEYMGVLLVVSVIIAGVAQTDLGDEIVKKMSHLIDDIAGGNSGKQ